jgi:diadenosine tetraphosphate (Ap4A) HIT family hydrolase
MCDPKEYRILTWGNRKVCRVVGEDDNCYVIVPRESHLEHHLLVVLKPAAGQHKRGLIECTYSDISNLGKAISNWSGVLKTMGYDTVYAGCFSDEGHIHFHLFPFRFQMDKGKRGKALQWLAKKEQKFETHCFSRLTEKQKESRMDKIEAIVAELNKAKQSLCGKGIS